MVPWNPRIVIDHPGKVTPSMFVPTIPESASLLQRIAGTIVSPSVIEEHQRVKQEKVRIKAEEVAGRQVARELKAEIVARGKEEMERKKAEREAKKAMSRVPKTPKSAKQRGNRIRIVTQPKKTGRKQNEIVRVNDVLEWKA